MPDETPAAITQAHIRSAGLEDLDAITALEEGAFTRDRLSRRQLRYLLTRARASIFLAETRAGGVGYIIVLFRRTSTSARIYSVAVAAPMRGRGVGGALLAAAEAAARNAGCEGLRLEVRRDNTHAIALYRSRGYREIGAVNDYYEDHQGALRFKKALGSPS